MAQFQLTLHASEMLAVRGIAEKALGAVLDKPDLVRPDRHDESLENWYKVVPNHEGRVLKAVVHKEGDMIVVIAAYFDRSMRGKV